MLIYCCLTWWIFNCFFLSFQKVPGASGGALPKRRNAKLFLGIVSSCFHAVLFWPCLHVDLGSAHHCVWLCGSFSPLSTQTFTCFVLHKLIYFSAKFPARFNRIGVWCVFPRFSPCLPYTFKKLAWLVNCQSGGWMLLRFRKTQGLTARGASI